MPVRDMSDGPGGIIINIMLLLVVMTEGLMTDGLMMGDLRLGDRVRGVGKEGIIESRRGS